MYPDGLGFFVGLGVIIVWLGILTIWIYQQKQFLKKLFPGRIGNFRVRIEDVFKEVEKIDQFKLESLKNLQRVALVRFNPYRDTGGNQSFALTMLNGKGDGVIVTSLHARGATRIFAKEVANGKVDLELSEEENQSLKQALSK